MKSAIDTLTIAVTPNITYYQPQTTHDERQRGGIGIDLCLSFLREMQPLKLR